MRRGRRKWLWTLCVLVLLAGGLYVGVVLPEDRRGDAVARILAGARRGIPKRWDRPVLRGEPTEGNAAACLAPILARLRAAEPDTWRTVQGLEDVVVSPSPRIEAAVRVHADMLEELRACGRRTWSWARPVVEQGGEPLASLNLASLLLVDAQRITPGECLRRCADVIRLAQDAEVGVSPAADTAAMLVGAAVMVASECARGAAGSDARGAAREVGVLAAHPPPIGAAIEGAMLEVAGGLLEESRRLHPALSSDGWERLVDRRANLATASALARTARRFRSIDGARFPEGIAFARRAERRLEATAPARLHGSYGTAPHRTLQADLAMQTFVRELAVVLEAVAAAHGSWPREPPAAIRRAELRDPWTGQPLRYRLLADGSGLLVHSLGPDGRDDAGERDDLGVLVRPPRGADAGASTTE